MKQRKKLTMEQRAAQFLPFKALEDFNETNPDFNDSIQKYS